MHASARPTLAVPGVSEENPVRTTGRSVPCPPTTRRTRVREMRRVASRVAHRRLGGKLDRAATTTQRATRYERWILDASSGASTVCSGPRPSGHDSLVTWITPFARRGNYYRGNTSPVSVRPHDDAHRDRRRSVATDSEPVAAAPERVVVVHSRTATDPTRTATDTRMVAGSERVTADDTRH